MAISAATVQRAYDFTVLRQDHYTTTDEYEVVTCKVDCIYATTDYAQANDATFAPATAIQNASRDGLTPTILQACMVAPGMLRTAAASTTVVLIGADACTNSGGTVTHQLTTEDMSTELANAYVLSTATWVKPITFQVTFMRKLVGE